MSNKYEAKGRIKAIGDTQTFASGFQKREFVVTVPDGDYSQEIKFEVLKDKVTDLDSLHPNDEITVHFNIRGNEHNGRHYVNLVAWRIEQHEQAPSQIPPKQEQPHHSEVDSGDGDDIPF
jgi:hypothetical protein